MTVPATTFPLTALVLPLLTSGAAWAIAVWALKQDGARIKFLEVLKPPASANGLGPAAALPQHSRTPHDEKNGECQR